MTDVRPRTGAVVQGISSGLTAMAIFTPVYALWPVFAWPLQGGAFFAAALAYSIFLALRARSLLVLSRTMPFKPNAFDKRLTKWIGIISSIQGILILVSTVVLVLLGLSTWILPTVALIVALHFFPMPALFSRTIDYYLGGGMLLVAVLGLHLAGQAVDWRITWGVTGIGSALVTSSYGIYMVLTARAALRAHPLG